MLGSPKASPAWIVKCAFSRRRYSKASRKRVGGKPASAPAMSKPAHLAVAVAHGELGDLAPVGGVPHRGEQGAHADGRTGRGRLLLSLPEAGEHGLDDPLEREARRPRAARGRSATRRRRHRRQRGRARTRGRPGPAAPRSASRRRCARRSPGNAPATRSRRRHGTSGRARRRPGSVGRGSPRPRPARRRSRAAARRRGGRGAAPSARGGPRWEPAHRSSAAIRRSGPGRRAWPRGRCPRAPSSRPPSSAASARSKRSGVSVWRVSSTSPSRTASPGFAWISTPAPAWTGSSFRARPAPSRHAATPTA